MENRSSKITELSSTRSAPLGRGLSALFGDDAPAETPASNAPANSIAPQGARPQRHIQISQLIPSPVQPRRHFSEEAIRDLAASIKEHGILQPLLVRPAPSMPGMGERFEIIAGERRWRAAQLVGLHELPVMLREMEDREALEVALIENVQRQDLSPLEEAEGYQRLLQEFRHTQEDLAKTVGKSRSHIANTLRLLQLPASVRAYIQAGQLTAGHARAIMTAKDPGALAQLIVKKQLSVRQAEKLAKSEEAGLGKTKLAGKTGLKDADTLALEKEISGWLGLKTNLSVSGSGGSLQIHYETLDQLEDVMRRLKK